MADAWGLERRARWAQIALAAVIVADLIGIWSDWVTIRLLDRALDGESIAISTFDSDDVRQGLVGLLQLVVLIAAVTFFLRWFHRGYVHLPHLGATRRFGTRWAIGAWFVPILNLWRPKQISDDIWRGTDPGSTPGGRGTWGWKSSWLLTVWWVGWVVVSVLDTRAGMAWWGAPLTVDAGPAAAEGLPSQAEDARSVALLDLVTSLLDVPVAVLAILVVRALTARVIERARLVAALAPSPAPAETPL
jgi:hypothetical protein